MSNNESSHIEIPFLRRRFPEWPEEKMREAERIYLRFLKLQWQIFEEYELGQKNHRTNDLTEGDSFGIN